MESWFAPNADCSANSREHGYSCDGSCSAPVKRRDANGRWYITMGHPGFNSWSNNGQGYKSEKSARAAMAKYTCRYRVSVGPNSWKHVRTFEDATKLAGEIFNRTGVVVAVEPTGAN